MNKTIQLPILALAIALCWVTQPLAAAQVAAAPVIYNPSVSAGKVTTYLTEFNYGSRKVPLKIYLPAKKNAPVILISHGLGGTREVGAYLANHWSGRGFAVVAMQHAGSDADVWKDTPRAQRLRVMKKAASMESFMDRTKDVPAVIDQITKWTGNKSHALHGRLNMDQLGIGGHSFGAITSQAVSGQSFGALGTKFTDKRIDAALMLSPSPAKQGKDKKAFGQVAIPWMLMTGTKDTSIIKPDLAAADRLLVYPALPQGGKYELVLKDAKHMAFSDRTMLGSKHRNKNHHRVIKALSTAFWEAHLLDDRSASVWLQGGSPLQMLQAGDTWKRK